MIDVSSVDNRNPDKEESSKERVRALTSAWSTRTPTPTLQNDLQVLEKEATARSSNATQPHASSESVGAHLDPTDEKRPGFLRQTMVLTARAHRNVYRNVPQLAGFAIQAILLGLVIGLTYYQLPEVGRSIR